MESEESKMNGSNILEWSDEMIIENLNYALSQVCLHTKSSDDVSCLEYVTFSLDKLLPHVPLIEVEEKLLQVVCSASADIFLNMKRGIENFSNTDSLSQTQFNSTEALCHLTTVCCDILRSLQRCCEHFIHQSINIKYNYVKSLVSSIKIVVSEALTHCLAKRKLSGTQNVSPLMEFHQATCELLSSYLQLVAHKIEFSFVNDSDVEAVVTIAGDIMVNAILTCDMDGLVLADTWKKFISMVEKYQDYLKINLNVSTSVKHLCRRILKDLENFLLLSETNFKETINKLKISNFLLKIVVKLCRIFATSLLEVAISDLLDLLLALYRLVKSFSYVKSTFISPLECSGVYRFW